MQGLMNAVGMIRKYAEDVSIQNCSLFSINMVMMLPTVHFMPYLCKRNEKLLL